MVGSIKKEDCSPVQYRQKVIFLVQNKQSRKGWMCGLKSGAPA
jgi:hypothetical protein